MKIIKKKLKEREKNIIIKIKNELMNDDEKNIKNQNKIKSNLI